MKEDMNEAIDEKTKRSRGENTEAKKIGGKIYWATKERRMKADDDERGKDTKAATDRSIGRRIAVSGARRGRSIEDVKKQRRFDRWASQTDVVSWVRRAEGKYEMGEGSSIVAVGKRLRDQRGLSPPVFAPGKHPLRWVLLSVVERKI
ncbi:unnamed protein product [Lactuca virosa]|uniref:Uncharacterized protein n=1 Tax=Lactuca virosa TaxID=75947 RepID=A0AAU9NJU5_9ASTR|nr:unnamed protein product [Lactuca virosa]